MKHKTCFIESLEVRRLMATERFYYIGNSMTDGLGYTGMRDLFASDGSTNIYGRQTRAGSTISGNYYLDSSISTSGYDPARPTNTNPWGNWTQAFANQWDSVSLQPNERRHITDLEVVGGVTREEGEVPSMLRYMDQLAINSPNAQVYVYSRPARRTDIDEYGNPTGQTFDYSNRWNGTYYDSGPSINYEFYTRSSVTQLMPLMRKAQAADPIAGKMPLVKLIPAGEAYYNIDQALKAGKFAGTPVTSMLNFYIDHTHPTPDLAAYVLALTFYASLTGNDPRGMGIPNAYAPQSGPLSNVTVTTLIQQAVYDAVHDAAYRNWTSAMPGDAPKPGSISIRTYSDTSANYQLDAGDTNLAGMQVYLDKNENAMFDPDEPVAVSDADGIASFLTVDPGNYVVRSDVPDGMASTFEAVNVSVRSLKNTEAAFGYIDNLPETESGSLRVRVFTSSTGTGAISDTDLPVSNVQVFVDLDHNGVQGPDDLALMTDVTGTVRFDGLSPGNYNVRVVSGGVHYITSITLSAQTVSEWKVGIANSPAHAGQIKVKVFEDKDRNGNFDLADTLFSGITVFLDTDKDGRLDSGETFAETDASGAASFNSLSIGTYRVRVIPPANHYVSQISMDGSVVLNGSSSHVSIGLSKTPTGLPPDMIEITGTGSISGYIVNDTNNSGTWSGGEAGIAGRTVWIDYNNNGTLDNNETTAITASNGKYTFSNLASGTYYIRPVNPSGWSQTYPLSNAAYKVVLGIGVARTGIDICVSNTGTPPPPPPSAATISGTLFFDYNKNGLLDGTDTTQSGKTVYIDANSNGIFDATESSTTTSSTGTYSFTGLAAGTYKIRRVVPSGYVITTPPRDITVTASQVFSGVLIGTGYA